MQYIVFLIKKVVLALTMLYTIDLIIGSTRINIPINIISILLVTFLGLPAVIGLVVMQKFM